MRNWYQRGSANAICDVCGEKYKLSQLQKRWDGLWVCQKDYEERHPQDFLRARKESLHLPITKPRPQDTFVAFCTIFSQNAVANIGVASCMIAGNSATVALIPASPITPDPIPDLTIRVTIADNPSTTENITPVSTSVSSISGYAISGYAISGVI